jgi:two-component system, OmpR family, sensor kinase
MSRGRSSGGGSPAAAPDLVNRFRIPPPPRLSAPAAYALALLMPVVALLIEMGLRPWVESIPFVLFFFVVSLASSIGGWGPGALSVAASSACGWLFLSTSPSPDRAAGALIGASVFLPVAAVIAALGALVRAGFREREGAALALADAVRLRDEFISTASHELKTPLTSLSLVVHQLARRVTQGTAGDDPNLPRLVRSVLRQQARLTVLVNNLLDVSRINSGRMHLDLDDVDLGRVVEDVLEHFEGELDRAGTDVRVDSSGPVVGQWDRLRLEQVLTNLISNALKYGSGSPISIAIRCDPGTTAVLSVSNGGAGIPPEDHDRVFERFERGPHGSAPGGFGVGLWIVREIVTALGGTVRVASAPQQGATFTIALPVSGPPPEGSAVPR